MRRFAGCCRFVWNKALALEKETYEQDGKRHGYNNLAGLLRDWKKSEDTAFLADAHSQILQQSLKDLDRAYVNFFQKRAGYPRFKKRGEQDSFRYPQGFKLDEPNSRIFLPKIGWIRYRKSRDVQGVPKQVTVSWSAGKWYVSIQTERVVVDLVHPSQTSVGIDMGIARFATLSDGTHVEALNSFRKHEMKLARLQRKLSKKQKLSSNWQKQKRKLQKHHRKIANVRKDFLHKISTTISKNHAMVVMEDLQIKNIVAVDACTPHSGYRHGPSAHPLGRMSRSASGSIEQPGRNVSAKRGLNKAILDQGWFEFRRQLTYKLAWRGGKLIVVPPQYTSQTCSHCGYTDKANRKTQAQFTCVVCGFEANADYSVAVDVRRLFESTDTGLTASPSGRNAALNILAAGHAVTVGGVGRAQAPTMKQKPAYGAAR